MTVKKHTVDLNKAIGKPYSQQPGRKRGEGPGHIVSKEEKEKWLESVYNSAHEAGMAALKAATPTPMVVQQHTNQLDDNSPVQKEWFVEGGVCGFAWVNLRPANHMFVKWLRAKDKEKGKSADLAYGGGYNVWVDEGGQSMQRKEAYANAFADVISNEIPGLQVYVDSRMD